MKKIFSLLLSLALLAGALSGCTNAIDNSGYVPTGDALLMEGQDPEDLMPEEENTQELTLAYYPDRSLNPLFGSDYTNRVLMSLMYQGLFAVDNSKNVTPILCGSFQVSANSRNWTFWLDPNATFSDGTRVTPEDVIATYTKAKENDYYKNRFYHLWEMNLTEDGTGVIFQLDTPYENLPLLLDVPIVKASEVEAAIPLGTGPYIFTDSAAGATLQRVSNWWCGKTKIAATDLAIDLVEVTSPADVRDEFQFGDVSVVCANPMSDSFAEYRCDYELWEIESGYMMYIGCNILYSPHFDDGTLRTFLTYGIDRKALAEETYNGMVDTVTLPVSPMSPYYNEALASQYEYDSLKFINRLGSYRIPVNDKGVQEELVILVNANDSARVRIARTLADNLTAMGLPATTLESSNFKDVLYAQTWDIYIGMTRLSANFDLTEFFRPYGEMRLGGLSNEILYNMAKNALENSGNYYNLYQKLAEDGRIIPMMFGYYTVYAQRGLMPDLSPSRDNVFYYSLGKTMAGIQVDTVYEE
ncbi:MAG: hypothetical protein IJX67_09210 [Oscillospiraceae bacterium]|nr:hypothetical protein [Oscillospiraceae bacterium]